MGIIACVEVTTPITTTVQSSPTTAQTTTSGTTTTPASVQTTTNCLREMAQIGTVYVSSVTYSVQPVEGTNNADLTDATSNGVSFQSVPSTNGLFDTNNQPLYTIDLKFNPAGVNSLSSVVANPGSNVDKFSVEFYGLFNPNQLITSPSGPAGALVSYDSTYTNSQASILTFPANAPSDLSGIRISILSTTKDE